jgi:hypothetical protein
MRHSRPNLQKIVADLDAGGAIHRSDLDDHVERFTFNFPAARVGSEVIS